MSGSSPFSGFTGGNGLMPQRQPVAAFQRNVPPTPATPTPQTAPPFGLHHARAALANHDQEAMISKRDTAGNEMNELAKVANNPEDNNRADIVAYIGGLTRKGQVTPEEAAMIIQALPEDQNGIRTWARTMFNAVMQAGIHAHAAYPRELFPAGQQGGAAPAAAPDTNGATAAPTGAAANE